MSVADSRSDVDDQDRWLRVLNEFEGLLVRQTEALDGGLVSQGVDDDLVFQPPSALPTLPAHLVRRVEELLLATRSLIDRTRTLSNSVQPRERVGHPRVRGRPLASSHFDRKA